MVLVLFFSGYSMGKEHSSVNIDTNAKIAEPIVVVENSPTLEVDGKNQEEYYGFKVKNYRETGEITQIAMQYWIEIMAPKEEAISFKLYKEGEEIPLENNKTKNIRLEKGKVQEDCYQLEIKYDKTKQKETKDIKQEVQVKVHSEQVRV